MGFGYIGCAAEGFQLDDHLMLHEKVQPLPFHYAVLVDHVNGNLPLEAYPPQLKFMAKRFFVDRFQKPRPQHAMDFNAGPNYALRQRILFLFPAVWWPPVCPDSGIPHLKINQIERNEFQKCRKG